LITINLLPVREERRKAGLRQLVIVTVAALVGSICAVSAFHYRTLAEIETAKRAIDATQQEIDRFGPELAQVEEYRRVKADIEKKLEVISQLSDARSGPVHIFDELAMAMPERVWVTSIGVRGSQIEMSGMSLDNELVALFLTALDESPYFKNVELMRTEAHQMGGFKLNAFGLNATLTSPATEKRAAEAEDRKTAQNAGPQGSQGSEG
jgi:type IV pilus assembly protein PilN